MICTVGAMRFERVIALALLECIAILSVSIVENENGPRRGRVV